MRTTRTAVKLGLLWLVLLVFTVMVIVVFGQVRFNRTTGYSAVFTNVSGLRAGQFVRASGVEIGKVAKVTLIDRDTRVLVEFTVDRSLTLDQATSASIRYLNLIGDRYLELKRGDSGQRLAPGATIGVEHTEPALDLDALIGGFRPLFKALDPDKVNSIAQSIITVFQGQGATINDILDQTASLTASLADRDRAIGEVVNNLNTVLATTVKHQQEFDRTADKLEVLITGLKNRADPLAAATAHISNAAGTLADLLGTDRPLLHSTFGYVEGIQQSLINDLPMLDDVLAKMPDAYRKIGRVGGTYGDFFNFYLCDVSVKVNGLQPGGPVRTVKLFGQPTGRCTPQ
ncbi:MCE family protein [Mycobacterium decipiens]|uniref:Mammalian cell entry protein n=1 Tax=Mycobacterium decipiens TaxID=1430326 RepID=A0A1X2LZ92_9MYCO|nr:MlaD family protein [Mycobacterium decipiens]OSC42518.1 mammalian cell entry protein [Mycobacterium decipiens]